HPRRDLLRGPPTGAVTGNPSRKRERRPSLLPSLTLPARIERPNSTTTTHVHPVVQVAHVGQGRPGRRHRPGRPAAGPARPRAVVRQLPLPPGNRPALAVPGGAPVLAAAAVRPAGPRGGPGLAVLPAADRPDDRRVPGHRR